MKAVAMLLVWAGYTLLVYGVDHVANGCTPLRCVALGQFGGSQCGSGATPCPTVGTDTVSKLNKQGHGHTQTVQQVKTNKGPLTFGIGTAG